MARKKKVEEPKEEKLPKEDEIEILRLAKVVRATKDDMESTFALYKKYINPRARQYKTNCNCHNSISRYHQSLLDWFSQNRRRF